MALLAQYLHRVELPVLDGLMQRRFAVGFVLDVGVGLGVEEDFQRVILPQLACVMQRRLSEVVLDVDGAAVFDQNINDLEESAMT